MVVMMMMNDEGRYSMLEIKLTYSMHEKKKIF